MWLLPTLVFGAGTSGAVAPCASTHPPAAQGRVVDASLNEISGVALPGDGLLWVIEDSGNAPIVYGLDGTGAVKVRAPVAGVPDTDWEEIAAGPCGTGGTCLYIGDVGDNREQRKSVSVLRIPVPTADAPVTPEILRFTYPDGPQNVEAMTVTGTGDLRMYTKREDGVSKVYEVPGTFGSTVQARLLGTLPSDLAGAVGKSSRVTAASTNADGSYLWLRTYVAVFGFPADATSPTGWSAKGRVMLPAASEAQGEAIGWDASRSGYWQLSEAGDGGTLPTVWFTVCGG